MSAYDNISQKQLLYHASQHAFQPGDHIVPPAELNPENPEAAVSHPFRGGPRAYDTTFAATRPDAAEAWGAHLYEVRALGRVGADPNYTTDYDREVAGHLEVRREL